MKRTKILFAIVACLFLIVGNVDAQYGNTKKKKKKKTTKPKTERSTTDRESKEKDDEIENRIWYGLNVQNISFFNRTFSMGVAPHAGFKVMKNLSVGAMLKLDYYYEKGQFGFPPNTVDYKFSALDLGPTIFSRYKIGEQFFVQAEYERAFFQRPKDGAIILDNNGKVITSRSGEDYLYLGVGYGGGYPFGSYISLHYNLLDDLRSTRIPFDYRFGFVFNF